MKLIFKFLVVNIALYTPYPMFILVPAAFRRSAATNGDGRRSRRLKTRKFAIAASLKPRQAVLSFCAFDDFLCISFSCVCGNRI